MEAADRRARVFISCGQREELGEVRVVFLGRNGRLRERLVQERNRR